METRRCTPADLDELTRLRAALWPESAAADHRAEIADALSTHAGRVAIFVARTAAGEMAGFAEAALRRDHVNGCDTTPVVFLEGIYVVPAHRRRGVARALCGAVEAWGRCLGCTEFGSDADLANTASHGFHTALGFQERERVVFFRKRLHPEAAPAHRGRPAP